MFASGRDERQRTDREHEETMLGLGFSVRYPRQVINTATGQLAVTRRFTLDASDHGTRIDAYFDPPLPEGAHVHTEVSGDIAQSSGASRDVEKVVEGWVVRHNAVVEARITEMGGLAVAEQAQAEIV